MFGLRIVTKREMLLWTDKINDLKERLKEARALVEHERLRAEGAINLLLLKTQRAVLTPQDPLTLKNLMDVETKQAEILNMFGDESPDADEQDKRLEELQS